MAWTQSFQVFCDPTQLQTLRDSSLNGGYSSGSINGLSSYSSILGGKNNCIGSPNAYNSILGGAYNKINSGPGTSLGNRIIVGGINNTAANYATFIGGGNSHMAGGIASVIVGGSLNTATGSHSGVLVAHGSKVSGDYSVIVSGRKNYSNYIKNY